MEGKVSYYSTSLVPVLFKQLMKKEQMSPDKPRFSEEPTQQTHHRHPTICAGGQLTWKVIHYKDRVFKQKVSLAKEEDSACQVLQGAQVLSDHSAGVVKNA